MRTHLICRLNPVRVMSYWAKRKINVCRTHHVTIFDPNGFLALPDSLGLTVWVSLTLWVHDVPALLACSCACVFSSVRWFDLFRLLCSNSAMMTWTDAEYTCKCSNWGFYFSIKKQGTVRYNAVGLIVSKHFAEQYVARVKRMQSTKNDWKKIKQGWFCLF